MIKELRLENCVKYKDRTFIFNKGLTVIKGQNGNGKSLIQEMIRFALFGSSALRGKTSDYNPNLKVTLKCIINGDEVIINRWLKNCNINGGVIEGTTPCNEWIIKKLGYNLTVFDMGNASKQGEIAKLGKMKPSERKTAIDQIIGLSAMNKLIKELKTERLELKNYILGLESSGVLVEPEEPNKPDLYVESSLLRKELDEKRKIKSKYDLLFNKVNELRCDQPFWNEDIPQGDLKNESIHKFIKNKIEELENIGICESKYTDSELNDLLY